MAHWCKYHLGAVRATSRARLAQWEMHLYTPTLCKEGGVSLKILGSGAFLKGSRARASPLHVRGIPCGVIQHKTAPGDTERGGKKGTPNPKFLGQGGSSASPGWKRRADPRAQPEIYSAVTAAPPAAQLGLCRQPC